MKTKRARLKQIKPKHRGRSRRRPGVVAAIQSAKTRIERIVIGANPQPIPREHLKLQGLYRIGSTIARVVGIGSANTRVPYQVMGLAQLPKTWWTTDWFRRECRTDLRMTELPYVFAWDGNGVIFDTPKAERLRKELKLRIELGFDYQGWRSKPKSKQYRRVKKLLTAWEKGIDEFFQTPASKDAKVNQPAVVPKPPDWRDALLAKVKR